MVCRIVDDQRAGHPMVGLRVLGSSRSTTTCCTSVQRCARANTRYPDRTMIRGRGQEFTPRVVSWRFSCPELGVRTSRFELLSRSSGPSSARSSPTTTFKVALKSPGASWFGVGRGIVSSRGRRSGVCRCLFAPYKVSLSSPKPPDQSGHYSAVAVCRLDRLNS